MSILREVAKNCSNENIIFSTDRQSEKLTFTTQSAHYSLQQFPHIALDAEKISFAMHASYHLENSCDDPSFVEETTFE